MLAMPLVVLLALVVLLGLSVMVPAALKMKRLKGYPLAIIASILAMIVFPGNVIGLPIGIWSLIVLSRPDVRAAFGRPLRSPTARETRLGVTAFILSLCAIPIAVLVGIVLVAVMRGDPGGLAEIAGFTTFFLVAIPAWILGVVAWRSAWGKAAALVVPLLVLLLVGWLFLAPPVEVREETATIASGNDGEAGPQAVVKVIAEYPGASVAAVNNKVLAPIIEQLIWCDGRLSSITCVSSSGKAEIYVQGKPNLDLDSVAHWVNNYVQLAAPKLPHRTGERSDQCPGPIHSALAGGRRHR